MDRNIRIATLALFIAMAVALHWIESFIPRPAPFLRFGLANILTLCTLYTFGGLWALFVVISRVVIGSDNSPQPRAKNNNSESCNSWKRLFIGCLTVIVEFPGDPRAAGPKMHLARRA